MEPFFAITLSAIVLYKWSQSGKIKIDPRELRRNTVKARWDRKRIKAEKSKQEKYDEELITVIIPTINNDGK